MTATDRPGVIAPPPLIYLGFLLVGGIAGRLIHEPGLGLETPVKRGIALVLIVAGLILDGIAAGAFRRLGTPPEPWKATTALATTGVYGVSRNPIYVGFAMIYLGFAIAMDSPTTIALLVPCLIVVDRFVIAREERYLSGKFGATYAAYREKTRRWL